MLHEMRETGQLDTDTYARVKADMTAVKRGETQSQAFPAKQEEISYPGHGLNLGNPLYQTTNMHYGTMKPSPMDMPTKYYPRPAVFTKSFCGGQYRDQGFNTSLPKT